MSIKSPYLKNPHQLSDVLTAIQVMGTQKWDNRTRGLLGDSPQSAATWAKLFDARPEFFGSRIWYHLRLRHADERTFNPVTLHELTEQEIKDWGDKNKDGILSRKPLMPSQIEALMKTAIELQVRAAALEDRTRWWIPLVAAFLGFIGAVGGAALGSMLKGNATSNANDQVGSHPATSPAIYMQASNTTGSSPRSSIPAAPSGIPGTLPSNSPSP
jgi:hypothetical protein